MGIFGNFIRRWDLYKKVPDDLYISTYSGVCLSCVGVFLMTFLFALEFQAFLAIQTSTDIVLDQGEAGVGHSGMLAINFNISVHDLPCQYASIDISDVTGTRKHDIHQNIKKTRIDHKGRRLGLVEKHAIEPEEHDGVEHRELAELEALLAEDIDQSAHSDKVTGASFESYLAEHPKELVMMNFFAPWCIWCRRLEPVWENTAKKLMGHHHKNKNLIRLASVDCTQEADLCAKQYVRAYPTIYLFLDGNVKPHEAYHGERTTTALVSRAHKVLSGQMSKADKEKRRLHAEDKQEAREKGDANHDDLEVGHEGCNVAGRLMVKRVPGNFHMNLVSPRYSVNHEMVNSSHTVHRLNYGDPLSERMFRRYTKLPKLARNELRADKLDGREFHTHSANYTFVHYLKVVSKTFLFPDEQSSSSKDGDGEGLHYYSYAAFSNEHKEDDENPPSIMFQYDLSPMTVVTTFSRQPLYHFITNFCAIIGGVFAIIGVFDRLLATVLQGFNKKVL